LRPSLEQVSQLFKETLQEPNTIMSHVYFPLTTVNSILVSMEDGSQVEVATVGNEGMIGLPIFLGSDTMQTISIVQVPGETLRMPADTFKEAVRSLEPLRNVLQRYTQALFMLVAQSVACNRMHDIAQRCARWLLMTHDRVQTERFPVTQEFLSDMLGVRRASVSEVASTLQREGLIQYSRGIITVLDRSGLEARSCECYRIVRQEFERSLG
jgi:CRP-like cAMP-binding protein